MSWRDRDYHREDEESASRPAFARRLGAHSMVTWLLVANFVVFVWDSIFGMSSRGGALALAPWCYFSIQEAIYGLQLWRWVTYQFIHGDFFHIFFNMLGLFFFGPMMEAWWGSRRFLAFYLLCGMSGAVVYTLMSLVPGLLGAGPGALIGASGGLFGVLVGAAVIAPRQTVMLIFPPIPMQIRTMVLIFLGIAAVKVIVGHMNAGGEAAHLGGAALGFVLVKAPWLLNWADGASLGRLRRGSFQKRQEARQREIEEEEAAIDRILAKVKEHGLHSLSRKEKRLLQRATDRQRRAG